MRIFWKHSVRTLVTTGRLPMLDRLRGETDPVTLLQSVSGIGRTLAQRLHEELGIDSLEDLEAAANDGRMSGLVGIGKKKLAGITDTLAARLGRVRQPAYTHQTDEPSVEELLDVDREYREKAASGEAPTITARRFNPGRQAWLPILHTHRGERNYTALHSNTARAHQLGRTRDWVVLYYDGGLDERQATVITSQHCILSGKRIVRGRESECEQFYGGGIRAHIAYGWPACKLYAIMMHQDASCGQIPGIAVC
ncbi:MAG: DNA-binding protein [Acidobacteriia bacterium]|nr:DNA-binding protein [Terriglobia bacterium]